MNEFDSLAFVYDSLKRLFFGGSLDRAVTHFLSSIPADQSILILGGGTGDILTAFHRDIRITYLEKSSKMIQKAKCKAISNVQFICEDFLLSELNKKYDCIICPFFLDVFGKEGLDEALRKIQSTLNPAGYLFVTDFQSKNSFHKFFIRVMYWFFKCTTNIQADRLLDINQHILDIGFMMQKSTFFKGEMIFSRIYRMQETF